MKCQVIELTITDQLSNLIFVDEAMLRYAFGKLIDDDTISEISRELDLDILHVLNDRIIFGYPVPDQAHSTHD